MPFYHPTHVPSWKQGFARGAAESGNPELWDGLVGAWLPLLGPTGSTLFDLSGRGNHSTFAGTLNPSEDWIVTADGSAIRPTNPDAGLGSEYLTIPPGTNSQGQSEWSLVVRLSQTATAAVAHRKWWVESDASGFWQNGITYESANKQIYWYTKGESTGVTGVGTWVLPALLADPFTASVAFIHSPAQNLQAIYTDGDFSNSQSVAVESFNPAWTEDEGTILSGVDGNCWQLLRYNRALSPGEIRQLHVDPWALVRPKAQYYPPATASAPGAVMGGSGLAFVLSAAIEATGDLSGSTMLSFAVSAASKLSGSAALSFMASAASQATGKLSGSTMLGCTLRGDLSNMVVVGGPYRVAAGVLCVAGSVVGQPWSTGAVAGMVA